MTSISSVEPYAVVTGATGEIGKEIACGLAEKGIPVILAARNVQKAQALAEMIMKKTKNPRVEVEQVDLASIQSIRSFSTRLNARKSFQLAALVNNAAIVPKSKQLSKDGLEMQFATNVLSYFLLSTLLHPLLKKSALSMKQPTRIVNVASQLAGDLDVKDMQFDSRKYDEMTAYRQSKQANRMLSWETARRFKNDDIIVHACHPGVVTSKVLSGLGYGSGFQSARSAAATPIFLTTESASKLGNSKWWNNAQAYKCEFASDLKGAEALWNYCDKISAQKGQASKTEMKE